MVAERFYLAHGRARDRDLKCLRPSNPLGPVDPAHLDRSRERFSQFPFVQFQFTLILHSNSSSSSARERSYSPRLGIVHTQPTENSDSQGGTQELNTLLVDGWTSTKEHRSAVYENVEGPL